MGSAAPVRGRAAARTLRLLGHTHTLRIAERTARPCATTSIRRAVRMGVGPVGAARTCGRSSTSGGNRSARSSTRDSDSRGGSSHMRLATEDSQHDPPGSRNRLCQQEGISLARAWEAWALAGLPHTVLRPLSTTRRPWVPRYNRYGDVVLFVRTRLVQRRAVAGDPAWSVSLIDETVDVASSGDLAVPSHTAPGYGTFIATKASDQHGIASEVTGHGGRQLNARSVRRHHPS